MEQVTGLVVLLVLSYVSVATLEPLKDQEIFRDKEVGDDKFRLLMMIRLVDRLAEDTNFQPLPGVQVTANRSRVLHDPPGGSSSGDRLDNLLYSKVSRYLHSLTFSVRPLELNTTDIVDTVTGRKKGGAAGMGAMAVMLGGVMTTLMMSALAAMAGKALMTSMAALMLSAMGAMRGGGGGGGGGGSKTHYEIIAQPEVSHAHTHSAEFQHVHQHWKRSLGRG